MKLKKALTAGVVAGAVSLAIAGANDAKAEKHETEKCFGIVKAGYNDCAAADKSHSCMGQAAEDGNPHEWVAVPVGLCEKLVGGTLAAGEGADEKASCDSKSSCQGKEDHEG
ncbi:MAG: DUF2282 domain-containing protein [Rhodospirillales bacterium]|nr:DUF2282 domain-containing protein [Rhodospirillales bacterium]MCB9994916.1 DUF2282 domain-containing protein [Rhodospirillales bacterium]